MQRRAQGVHNRTFSDTKLDGNPRRACVTKNYHLGAIRTKGMIEASTKYAGDAK